MEYWDSKYSVEWAYNRAREDKSKSWNEVMKEWEEY